MRVGDQLATVRVGDQLATVRVGDQLAFVRMYGNSLPLKEPFCYAFETKSKC